MRATLIAVIACGVLAIAACSKYPVPPTAVAPVLNVQTAERAPPPAAKVNLAVTDIGGAYGTANRSARRGHWPRRLPARQAPNGGLKEIVAIGWSNAFATGEVLYAFKQAGVNVRSEIFRRGAIGPSA